MTTGSTPVPTVRTGRGGLGARLDGHYRTAKLLGHARLMRRRRRLRDGRPLLVHQMGKVASQSVARSLESPGRLVYQTHFLSEAGQRRAEAVYRHNWDPARGGPLHLWQAQSVRRELARSPGARWQVVTLVRDPVARNLSSFFQVAELQFGVALDDLRVRQDLVDAVRERFLTTYDEHELPLRWLDDELRAPLGVDAYSQPFPHQQGYVLLEGARADVLVLRYEDLARAFSDAVAQLLDGERVELLRTNVSRDKGYGDVYQAVTAGLTLPEDYLDQMYGSRYARHFYTPEELKVMRARWSGAAG